jgi:tRNA(fMet)-specific endonuclease VapC
MASGVAFILDTNTVSELLKGTPAVVERLAATDRARVAVPQPVLAELAYGIARLPASKRRSGLQGRFELVCAEIARAEWTDDVSLAYGRIKATLERRGERIEDFDAAIAAHAIVLGATLVTGNIDHMARIAGLEVESWTE